MERIAEVLAVLARCVQLCPHCRRPWTEPAPLASHAVCPFTVAQAEALFDRWARRLAWLRRKECV